jgi:hypothetical protein
MEQAHKKVQSMIFSRNFKNWPLIPRISQNTICEIRGISGKVFLIVDGKR